MTGLALLFGLVGPVFAQARGGSRLSEQFVVSAEVHPVFDILETRRVPGGHQLRVLTNMSVQNINGVSYELAPGENLLFVPDRGAARGGERPVAEVLY